MRGKTHCTIGILSTIQACILFKIPISIFNLVLAAIFSILPDLDESNSTISNVFLKQDASKLILSTDCNVNSVSSAIGIASTSYFIKLFKCYYGVTPKQYYLTLKR